MGLTRTLLYEDSPFSTNHTIISTTYGHGQVRSAPVHHKEYKAHELESPDTLHSLGLIVQLFSAVGIHKICIRKAEPSLVTFCSVWQLGAEAMALLHARRMGTERSHTSRSL